MSLTKKQINKLKKTSTEDLEARLKELEPLKNEYYEIYHILEPRWKIAATTKKRAEYNAIVAETKYVEPDYPSMGFPGVAGSAIFTGKRQANKLLGILNKNTSYYYVYVLEWDGKGEYIVEPHYKYDHDNEIVYTAIIKKAR